MKKYTNTTCNVTNYDLKNADILAILKEIEALYPQADPKVLEAAVFKAVNSIRYSNGDSFEKQCIIQDALVSVLDSLATYNPAKGDLGSHVKMGASRARQVYYGEMKCFSVRHEFGEDRRKLLDYMEKNRTKTLAEAAEALGLTYSRAVTLLSSGNASSMDKEDEDGNTLGERLPDNSSSKDLYGICMEGLRKAYPQYAPIYEEYLWNGQKCGFGNIARHFGMKPAEITKAISTCKDWLEKQRDSILFRLS